MKKRFLILSLMFISVFSFTSVRAGVEYINLLDKSDSWADWVGYNGSDCTTPQAGNTIDVDDYVLAVDGVWFCNDTIDHTQFIADTEYTILINVVEVTGTGYLRHNALNGIFDHLPTLYDEGVIGTKRFLTTSMTPLDIDDIIVWHTNNISIKYNIAILEGDYTSLSDDDTISIIENAQYLVPYGLEPAIITDFLAIVGAWLVGVWVFIGASITGAVSIFYDDTPVTGGFTTIGILSLFGLAFSLVLFGLAFVKGLIKN